MKNKFLIFIGCFLLSSCVLRDTTPIEPEIIASEIVETETTSSHAEPVEKTTLKLTDDSERFLEVGDVTSITIQSNNPDIFEKLYLKVSPSGVVEYSSERLDDFSMKYNIIAVDGGIASVRVVSEDQSYSTKVVTVNVAGESKRLSAQENTSPSPSEEEVETTPDNIILSTSGTGDSVVRSVEISVPSKLTFDTSDTGHYAVKAYYGDNDWDYDLLINDSGSWYDGTVYLLSDRTYDFEIDCSGEWEIEIQPIDYSATRFYSASGWGDDVTDIALPSGKYCEITYTGSDHFAVKQWYGTGKSDYKLLVNESGEPYSGTVRLANSDMLCFFEIIGTDGFWTIRIID